MLDVKCYCSRAATGVVVLAAMCLKEGEGQGRDRRQFSFVQHTMFGFITAGQHMHFICSSGAAATACKQPKLARPPSS